MKYRNIIITLGFLVMIMQSIGFPQNVRNIMYLVIGALIISLGYLSNKMSKPKSGGTQNPPADNINSRM